MERFPDCWPIPVSKSSCVKKRRAVWKPPFLLMQWMNLLPPRLYCVVTPPDAALPTACVLRSASMKMNWSGAGAQVNCVPCAALLTLVILSSNRVPDPESGAKSFEKADIRSVLIGPLPGITFPDTFQLQAVSPAFWTGGLSKVIALSSKVKSPWNPTRLFFASISEVLTAAVKLLLDWSRATSGSVTAATVETPGASGSGPLGRGLANGVATSPKTIAA